MTETSDSEAGGPAERSATRLTLDRERCIGVGQCEMLAPEVFRLDDDEGTAVLVGSPWRASEQAHLLADKCPSGAIKVAEE